MKRFSICRIERTRPQLLSFYETLEQARQAAFELSLKGGDAIQVVEIVGAITAPKITADDMDKFWTPVGDMAIGDME